MRLLKCRSFVHGCCGAVLLSGVLMCFPAAIARIDSRLLVDGGGAPMGLSGSSVRGGDGVMRGYGAFQRLLGP